MFDSVGTIYQKINLGKSSENETGTVDKGRS